MALFIDVIDQSSVVDGPTLATYCAAIQKQARHDFAPIWGVGFDLNVSVRTAPVKSTGTTRHMTVYILDDSDVQGALGYHDVDALNNPYGRIFAKTDQRYGLSLSVTMSHEILEMLGDFFVLDGCQVSTSTWAAREMCDPCESDAYGYQIDGVLVSDFITPRYFVPSLPGPYDFGGHLKKGLTLLPGGYQSLWSQSTGWTQQQAQGAPGVASRAQTMERHVLRALTSLGMAMLPVQTD